MVLLETGRLNKTIIRLKITTFWELRFRKTSFQERFFEVGRIKTINLQFRAFTNGPAMGSTPVDGPESCYPVASLP